MHKNEDDTYTVQLSQAGVWDARGTVCPPEELQRGIEKLKLRAIGSVNGEYGTPQWNGNLPAEVNSDRMNSVDQSKVCCTIDLDSLHMKDGALFAKVKPSGALGEQLKELLQKEMPTFGMRAFVQYREGNATRTHNHVVSKLDIVTFDLINPEQ